MPLFTVLLPVHRPPHLLPLAIESVLEQSVADFELCVICDGAPPETAACADEYARRDPRVSVLVHPKGARHGEAYRHEALARSTARYVAHISDDDLWFPDHLAEMETLLSAADFGNLTFVYLRPGEPISVLNGDLAQASNRLRMQTEIYNFVGLTHAGYRLEAYRALPVGWTPAPPGLPTDLHMWRKFLAMENLRVASRAAITSLTFPAPARADMTFEQRAEENHACLARIRDPRQRDAIIQQAWRSLFERLDTADAQRHDVRKQIELMTASRDDLRVQIELMTASRDDYRHQVELMTAARDALQAEKDALMKALAAQTEDKT